MIHKQIFSIKRTYNKDGTVTDERIEPFDFDDRVYLKDFLPKSSIGLRPYGRSTWVEHAGRIYRAVGNVIYVSMPIQWDRLAYGGSITACPECTFFNRFVMHHRWLRSFMRRHNVSF